MKNTTIGLIIAGGCLLLLLLIGLFYGIRKFYNRTKVNPNEEIFPTKRDTNFKPFTTRPNPNNPINYGIGHQRMDQETNFNRDW